MAKYFTVGQVIFDENAFEPLWYHPVGEARDAQGAGAAAVLQAWLEDIGQNLHSYGLERFVGCEMLSMSTQGEAAVAEVLCADGAVVSIGAGPQGTDWWQKLKWAVA